MRIILLAQSEGKYRAVSQISTRAYHKIQLGPDRKQLYLIHQGKIGWTGQETLRQIFFLKIAPPGLRKVFRHPLPMQQLNHGRKLKYLV